MTTATEEQIARVEALLNSEYYSFSGMELTALAAVLAELTALREENAPLRGLRDAVVEHDEAAKHDRLQESGFARHNSARRNLDAALAACGK